MRLIEQNLERFLNRKVKIAMHINNQDMFYVGVLTDITDTYFGFEDRQLGFMILRQADLRRIHLAVPAFDGWQND